VNACVLSCGASVAADVESARSTRTVRIISAHVVAACIAYDSAKKRWLNCRWSRSRSRRSR
jgi:hypothetical protein